MAKILIIEDDQIWIDLLTDEIHEFQFEEGNLYNNYNAVPVSASKRWGFENLLASIQTNIGGSVRLE